MGMFFLGMGVGIGLAIIAPAAGMCWWLLHTPTPPSFAE